MSLIIPLGPWIDQLARDQRPLPLLAKLDAMAEVTIWAPAIALGVTLPALLVPNGRLRSRRWRVVAAAAVAGPVMFVAGAFLIPGTTSDTVVPFDNPFGQPGLVGSVATGAAIAVLGVTVPLGDLRGAWVDPLVILCVPVTVAVAVLRYRLWDLDRLVSRTVTYALVTALLVIPYVLVVPTASKLVEGSGSLAVAVRSRSAADGARTAIPDSRRTGDRRC